MPKYRMQAPDGKTYEIDGPAGATDDQVKATILAQNPHLSAPQPQARPVLSARPAAPKPQAPAAPQQNWFQRAASGVGNAVGGTFRGIQDEIPGIDHVAAMGNEIGQALHLNKSTMSYADRVKYYHDQRHRSGGPGSQ